MKALFPLLSILILLNSCNTPSESSDWRGPARDGIYPETGLLKQWPEEGPELLWSFEGLGYGHNAVAVANGRVYATGVTDTLSSQGSLQVLNTKGELLWKKDYGKDFTDNFIGARSTPVIVDGKIYLESGNGDIHCLNAENGNEIWSLNFLETFDVDSVIQFGYSESVLIDGDRLICVPGGKTQNVVALDRHSGEVIWTCEGNGEKATYNSPILVERGGTRLVIAMTAASIMGIDAESGELYWRVEQTQGNNIHANTPLYHEGRLVVASVDPKSTSGMVQLQLSEDGKKVEETWRNKKLRNLMGGIVRIDSCIYGSAYIRSDWQAISWNTGEMTAQNRELGGGSLIWADDLFYCYAEKPGIVALAEMSCDSIRFISQFEVPLGQGEHWARPVIDKGVLYIRHGDALMAYDIKASE